MPVSIDPPPGNDEIECARCGAHIYYELTRCPNCGVNLYEPEKSRTHPTLQRPGMLDKIGAALHRLTRRPYRAEEVFGDALKDASLYSNLLRKVGGDPAIVERLIDHERRLRPQATRKVWLQNAIQHWENDNNPLGKS